MTQAIDMTTVADARRRLRQLADLNPGLRWPTGAELAGLLEDDEMGETQQVAFRMPADLLSKIDAYTERLKREIPGVDWTRAAVVRHLLTKALEQADAGGRK